MSNSYERKRQKFSSLISRYTLKTLWFIPAVWSIWLCSNDNKLTMCYASVVMVAKRDGGESLAGRPLGSWVLLVRSSWFVGERLWSHGPAHHTWSCHTWSLTGECHSFLLISSEMRYLKQMSCWLCAFHSLFHACSSRVNTPSETTLLRCTALCWVGWGRQEGLLISSWEPCTLCHAKPQPIQTHSPPPASNKHLSPAHDVARERRSWGLSVKECLGR